MELFFDDSITMADVVRHVIPIIAVLIFMVFIKVKKA